MLLIGKWTLAFFVLFAIAAMLVVGVVVVNLSVGPIEFPPSRLGKASTALNILTGAAVLSEDKLFATVDTRATRT